MAEKRSETEPERPDGVGRPPDIDISHVKTWVVPTSETGPIRSIPVAGKKVAKENTHRLITFPILLYVTGSALKAVSTLAVCLYARLAS
jgi:hypothetical protein